MKELLALERALVVLGPSLHTGTLLGKVDNVAAQMAIVNQGQIRVNSYANSWSGP